MEKKTGIKYEVDHIIPVHKGGRHHPDNLQILTKKSHTQKTKTDIKKGEV